MTTPAHCPRCGATLPPDTEPDSCPKCLIRLGLERTEPGADTKTSVDAPRQPAPLPEELAADFPQLEILELLGQGGMGAVYKARQKSLDRLVALKILAVSESAGPDFAERFAREARALASLSHPSIVAVHDFGRSGDRYYLMMEYVDGADLHRLIRGGEIRPQQALELVSQVCDALQFAHESGVVHRDIKPENILVDKRGRAKIADFGLAKILGRSPDPTQLTGARQVMGTAHYMAPEQLERPLEVDHRADIFSLGVVFYELLTGELPIGRFQPPSSKIQVDVRIDDVVLKTLEKEPQLRYQQAGDLKTDVDGIKGSIGAARSRGGAARPPDDRWWVPRPSFVAVGILVVALLAMLWVNLDDRQPASERPIVEAPAAEPVRGTPPLVIAAARGQQQILTSLLGAGADVNATDGSGTTALSAAVDRGHDEIARILLARGADVNAARSNGVTPLLLAAARGKQEVVQMLLDAGADVDASDDRGWSPLLEAMDRRHIDIARLLLARGAEADAASKRGVTPLMIAAARGELEPVELLLDAGADVTAIDASGTSALSAAVDRGHQAIVDRLLAAGASE